MKTLLLPSSHTNKTRERKKEVNKTHEQKEKYTKVRTKRSLFVVYLDFIIIIIIIIIITQVLFLSVPQ